MSLLLYWAEFFISALSDIGDFLLFQPFGGSPIGQGFFGVFLSFLGSIGVALTPQFANTLQNLSIAQIILGTGLIAIIGAKAAKLFSGIK